MKIRGFRSLELNGYLSFDLRFNDSRSFLIGINGSGKTSVLRAIVGLLSPDVDWIMNSAYKNVGVEIENDHQIILIRSESVETGKLISVSLNGDLFQQDLLTADQYKSLFRQSREFLYEEDGEMISVGDSHASFPTGMVSFEFIKQLPTPIYLGLDRSTLPVANRRGKSRRPRLSRQPHATLRAFLDDSVAEAEEAAVSAVRRATVTRQNEAIELRKKILLTLFIPVKERSYSPSLPIAKDIRLYEQYRRSLKAAFKTLGLDIDDIAAAIDPFFSRLIEVASKLKGINDISNVFKDGNDHLWHAYRDWTELAPRIPIFEQAEKLVSSFNKKERSLFEKRDNYLAIMNSFFEDSDKTLIFHEDGALVLRLPSGEAASVYYLSSGERQLFVLITTLMFVEDRKQANILIIDEPELSLHMKWQEMFVDALIAANNDVQLILATHSPSIIVDHENCCVDLV